MKACSDSAMTLTANGEFCIQDYNRAKAFASFLPGVAGRQGIPLWAFYVNRGQCVCSMGVQDKQHAILEFLPANRAYQLTPLQGFRTFLKLSRKGDSVYYEPFQNHLVDREQKRCQRMLIRPDSLGLVEENESLGLQIELEYLGVPRESYPGLLRKLVIRNTAEQDLALEGLDGLPLIVPYGVNDHVLKHMRRTIEAFVQVDNYETNVPFFRCRVEPADRPDVIQIQQGHFYLGYMLHLSGSELVRPLVDPERVFGSQLDFSYPEGFLAGDLESLYHGQMLQNCLPCAMGPIKARLASGESMTYISIVGNARSLEALNGMIPALTRTGYVEERARLNRELIEHLTQHGLLISSNAALSQYARQNFLDNTLRGGFPHTLKGRDTQPVIHLYSRKHGDLERDYNDFLLEASPYSQGFGNYRDTCQNRRCDLLINPDVDTQNLRQFYNLIQLDSYNPLVVRETRYAVADQASLQSMMIRHLPAASVPLAMALANKPFAPGELLMRLQEHGLQPSRDTDTFLGDLLGSCRPLFEAEHGEGFWIDHWTYNLDLLQNFLSVHPEREAEVLFRDKSFGFYDNEYRVLPRDDKYVIWEGRPMQLSAVIRDEEKAALISHRSRDPHRVRTLSGHGEVYHTTLFSVLLCLVVNRMATLDPDGVGVEMEAGKPDWYDALNGLPGQMGSSLSVTLEIKRHLLFLREALLRLPSDTGLGLFEELYDFLLALDGLLVRNPAAMEYWDQSAALKEAYRERVRLGVSGRERTLSAGELLDFFGRCLQRLERGFQTAWDEQVDLPRTYFLHEVLEYQELLESGPEGEARARRNHDGLPCIRITSFKKQALPLFLEGPVHYLRCLQAEGRHEEARAISRALEESELYDRALGMFKVNASLQKLPYEIGRARVFTPGWLENESIWLHMEYKYLLELIRNGLYEDFYRHAGRALIPQLDPAVYGRSTLENCSFLVSSANPNPALHGSGYVARLSGATAEFLHMAQLLCLGQRPFRMDENELVLALRPALRGDMFSTAPSTQRLYQRGEWRDLTVPANCFGFLFLGRILVLYHNPERADTFGPQAVRPALWRIYEGEELLAEVRAESLRGEIVRRIRERAVTRIEVHLAIASDDVASSEPV